MKSFEKLDVSIAKGLAITLVVIGHRLVPHKGANTNLFEGEKMIEALMEWGAVFNNCYRGAISKQRYRGVSVSTK